MKNIIEYEIKMKIKVDEHDNPLEILDNMLIDNIDSELIEYNVIWTKQIITVKP